MAVSSSDLLVKLLHCVFFFMKQQRPPPSEWASDSSLSRPHDHRHSTLGKTPLYMWSARRRDLYLTTYDTHKRQTFMPPAGFESAMPARERPETHALDCEATWIGLHCVYITSITSYFWVKSVIKLIVKYRTTSNKLGKVYYTYITWNNRIRQAPRARYLEQQWQVNMTTYTELRVYCTVSGKSNRVATACSEHDMKILQWVRHRPTGIISNMMQQQTQRHRRAYIYIYIYIYIGFQFILT